MYLVHLEISNVKAIRSMRLNFRRGEAARRWTVLLGENGCGKSTVLRSIGLLLAGSEALSDLVGNPDDWIRNGANEARLKATISTAEGDHREVSLRIRRGASRDMLIKENSEGLSQLDAAIRKADRNYFVAGYGAFRRPPDPYAKPHSGRWEMGRAGQLATLFSSSSDLVSLEQWALDLDYRKTRTGRAVISDALAKLLPSMKFGGIDKRSRSVVMQTVDGKVPLRQLSEGYQAMAAWAGDILYRMTETFKDFKEPLTARGVLLIDEMDLHLHPVWKRKFVDFLNGAFPNLQIVATTHSPLSVQQCSEGELFVVRRERGRPTLVPFVGDPSKWRLSDLFLSPLIGLDTLDSPKVAALREKARKIELKPGQRTAAEKATLEVIREDLVDTTPLSIPEAPAFAKMIRTQSKLAALAVAKKQPGRVSASRGRQIAAKKSPAKLKAKKR